MTAPRHPRPETPAASSPRPSGPERRARERRVLRIGLVLSVVVHLVAIGIVGDWLSPDGPAPPRPSPMVLVPPQGMRAVEISESPAPADAAAPAAPVIREDDDADEPEPVRRTPSPTPEPDARRVAADDLTAAERLAPRVVDTRLWEPMVLIPREPSFSDVEARVAAAVELLSDSALAEADRALRSRDWTVKDGNGGKWGISPGKLHLGKLTLPLPIYFVGAEEWDPAQAEWYDLEAQVDRAMILDSFEERVRAIRERRDRERAERREPQDGGG